MKRTIFIIFTLLTSYISVSAQDIETVLLNMPDGIIAGLETTHREQLLLNPQDTASITVSRGELGTAKRKAISSDYIEIQTSEIGTTQIKLLPLINDSKIICVVKTVCAKVCDSQMQFYTTSWMPIPQKELFPEKNKEWFFKKNIDRNDQDFQNAYASVDMSPMKIRLSPNDTSLIVYYELEKYLSVEDYKKIESYIAKEPKVFSWDRSSFK